MNNAQSSLSLGEIKKRVVSSFITLTTRQIALRAISFVTLNIILAKVLPVETLGIFNIATAIITFFAFFSDIGLAASLIQKKNDLTSLDIKTVFTIQQAIVLVLSLMIILGASTIGNFYGLEDDAVWLVRVLGISFFLSSLKVVPAVILERNLQFQPLVVVEIVETLVFNALLIIFVFQNFGIWSFSIAAVARGISGTSLLYILSPTRVGIGVEKEALKQLLSFGIPYQLNSLLALTKDRLVPLVIAKMIGPVGIGYVTWSQALAFLPLEIMNIVIRITFPAFSRLQDDKISLGKAIEKSLFVSASAVYPMLFGIGALLPSLITFVVSDKWQPAMQSFYFFAFSTLWAVVSTTFTNALNAIGQVKTTLKLMIFWTILTWILTPILVLSYGFTGVAIASFIISFTSVITVIIIKRVIEVGVLNSILLPLASSLTMGIVVNLFAKVFVKNEFTLVLAVLLGGIIYILLMLLLSRGKIIKEIKSLRYA